MKRLDVEAILLLLLTLICTMQAMLALSLSLFQVRGIESDTKPDVILYGLGIFILFLLVFSMIMIIGRPLVVSFLFSLFWNVIALINYYTILFHGTVLTHQDIRNITTAAAVIGSYSFRITRIVCAILLSFVFVLFLLALAKYKKILFK